MVNKFSLLMISLLSLIFLTASPAWGMHIMEGFLPLGWCIFWGALSLPFILAGFFSIRKTVRNYPKLKLLIAMAGAFTFVLSALKIPSVTGSCSHPTGVGFGAVLFGPTAMSLLGLIVLLFQALLLAHGGVTTLGANVFSMAIVGPLTAFGAYKLLKILKSPQWLAVFLATALGDLFTYITTSVQLALAFPAEIGGFLFSLAKFMSIFAFTQIPLAVSEGILTVLIFKAIVEYNKSELMDLKVLSEEV